MGHSQNIYRSSPSDKGRTITSNRGIFFDYGSVVIFHKKTERIIAALFLITEYLTNDNPIRHKIRYLGVELMSYIISTQREETSIESSSFVRTYLSQLLEITSLLEVAFLSEQISEMNFHLLGSEIEHLAGTVEKIMREDSQHADTTRISKVFSRDSNRSGDVGVESVSSKLRKRIFSRGRSNILHGGGRGLKDIRAQGRQMSGGDLALKRPKIDRKDIILKSLSEGRHMGVRDFLSVLGDVSEKTIQRDLAFLVSSGVLKKEGSRRWSKYHLSDTSPRTSPQAPSSML